jgi:hypothetical protein
LVEANGVRFAYRRFGKKEGVPLVFIPHILGNMDSWDPSVTDGFAQTREVIRHTKRLARSCLQNFFRHCKGTTQQHHNRTRHVIVCMFFAKQASRHIKKAHSKNIAYLWNILSNGTSQKVGFSPTSSVWVPDQSPER